MELGTDGRSGSCAFVGREEAWAWREGRTGRRERAGKLRVDMSLQWRRIIASVCGGVRC
jgi:hypothetical protein